MAAGPIIPTPPLPPTPTKPTGTPDAAKFDAAVQEAVIKGSAGLVGGMLVAMLNSSKVEDEDG